MRAHLCEIASGPPPMSRPSPPAAACCRFHSSKRESSDLPETFRPRSFKPKRRKHDLQHKTQVYTIYFLYTFYIIYGVITCKTPLPAVFLES